MNASLHLLISILKCICNIRKEVARNIDGKSSFVSVLSLDYLVIYFKIGILTFQSGVFCVRYCSILYDIV